MPFKNELLKATARFFLMLFTVFLMTPTVVTLIKHNVDVSYVFAFTEEENKTSEKTGEKTEFHLESKNHLQLVWQSTKKNAFDFYLMHEKPVYLNLFSPPPEAYFKFIV